MKNEFNGIEKEITGIDLMALCDECGVIIKDVGEFSDGYHTFNGLYHQRCILFAALCNTFKELAWKSHRHSDGEECFNGGWFIVGIDTPEGSYTYHYENEYWDLFHCCELEVGKEWDGHTEDDVERLLLLETMEKRKVPKKSGRHPWKPSDNSICWIPVEDGLPLKPEHDWVLVKVRLIPEGFYGVPHVAELRDGVWYCDCCDGPMEECLGLKVTHWADMTLIRDQEDVE